MISNRSKSKSIPETHANENQGRDKSTLTLNQLEKALVVFSTKYSNSILWEDIKKIYEDSGAIGEIRTPEDWRSFPRDVAVRVVFLHDLHGPLLRWSIAPKQWSEQTAEVSHELYLASIEGSEFECRRLKRRLKELHGQIITHEKLATYKPSNDSCLRTGYITLNGNNELKVNTANGEHMFYL